MPIVSIYNNSDQPIKVMLENAVDGYKIYWINPDDGKTIKLQKEVMGGEEIEIKNNHEDAEIIWITQKKKN